MTQQEFGPHEDPLGNYDPGPAPADTYYDDSAPEAPIAGRTATRRAVDSDGQRLNPIEMGAERSILSALLTTPKVFDELCDRLTSEDFGAPVHESIYAAIVACDSLGRPFDVITVADEMSRAGSLAQSDRHDYLQQLAASSAAVENLDAYVDIVLDRSLRRRMTSAARIIGTAALNPENDATTALDIAEQHVFELGQKRSEPSLAPMAQVIAKTQAEMARSRGAKVVGRATGITRLDEVTGGLRGGQLIIIAARPAMGKSVLALQIAMGIAEREDMPVPFFSYEMQHEELGIRLLASRTGISMNELNRGHIPQDDGMDRVFAREVEKLGQVRLLIDDQPPASVTALRSEIRRLARRGPLGAVVVDYLQLLDGDNGRRSENRTQEVAFISRTLKLLAVELNVPIIAVSQLSRQSESRPNKRPMLNDLRESGSLEQDANLVLALYREWVYDRTCDEAHSELLILKNRQGPLEEIAVDFQGACARFMNTDRELERGPVGGFGGPAGAPGGGFGGGGRGGGFGNGNGDLF